jgi:DNA polymerase I
MPTISINQVEYSTARSDHPVPTIHVFGRDESGTSKRLDITGFMPYFYASEPLPPLPKDTTLDPNQYHSIKGEPCRRIYTVNPSDVKAIREEFSHMEADVLFTVRFLVDTNLKSGVSFLNNSYECDYREIHPVDVDYPARVCFADIECSDKNGWPDSKRDPITCITCYDSFDKFYTTFLLVDNLNEIADLKTAQPLPNGCFDPKFHQIKLVDNEKGLLLDFSEYITNNDPDILTGWNFTDFDMPYILERFDALEISREEIARLPGKSDRIKIRGRQIFDLLAGYKRMHQGEKDSYRLDAIAKDEIKEEKVHFTGKLSDLSPSKMVEYNFKDVELCVKINAKDEIVDFHREIAKYIGCPLESTLNSMPTIDVLILRKAHGKFVLPSKRRKEAAEEFEGAMVFPPKKGLHKNVVVLDLASLYPIIMITGNMSPDTKDPKGEIITPTGIRFKKSPDGMVRSIQSELMAGRKTMKEKRNSFEFGSRDYKLYNMKQDVIKVQMNSYYGVSGNSTFRLYDRDIGASVTSVGREILKHNKKLIEEEGLEVILGDTDSCLAPVPEELGLEGTIALARKLEKKLNESYPAFAKKVLNADISYFSIKFEKLYQRFFSGGKKKRYAGLLIWKEGKTVKDLDIVGFESKRSDSAIITKTTQKFLMEMILNGDTYKTIKDTMREIIKKYQHGDFDYDQIGIPGGISKNFEDYGTETIQIRGAKYSNKNLGMNFGKMSKPKRLYIKMVPPGYPKTDVLCFDYADQVPKGFVVDIKTMLEKTLQGPLERILEALGWNWKDFDPSVVTFGDLDFGGEEMTETKPKQTKVSPEEKPLPKKSTWDW